MPPRVRYWHSVYRLFAEDDTFLYVGVSSDPPARLRQHYDDKPWWTEVHYALFEHYETKAEALQHERDYIRRHNPKHNITYEQRRWGKPRDPHSPVTPVEEKAA